MDKKDIVNILSKTDATSIETIRARAEAILLAQCGNEVYYRGLIEFSNVCTADCLYCGIRRSNSKVRRYLLKTKEILEGAQWCSKQGYGSILLQAGEQRDGEFIDTVIETVHRIKSETGLGVTLCVGEQTRETYRRFFEAGAHRYLLRIETSNRELFRRIHPAMQSFDNRLKCLRFLRETGFQVGTGVMIGLPGQTVEDLANDILFFVDQDIDMIGMGPFVPHENTPLGKSPCLAEVDRMRLSLLMIAATRLAMPDINIAATTALQTLDCTGREKGLTFGANVIMPLLTPAYVRLDYLLYPGKPNLDETASRCLNHLETRVRATGRIIGYNKWGDSPRALKRKAVTTVKEAVLSI